MKNDQVLSRGKEIAKLSSSSSARSSSRNSERQESNLLLSNWFLRPFLEVWVFGSSPVFAIGSAHHFIALQQKFPLLIPLASDYIVAKSYCAEASRGFRYFPVMEVGVLAMSSGAP